MHYYVELANARVSRDEAIRFLKEVLVPTMRTKGYPMRVLVRRYGLGPVQFVILSDVAKFAELDGWFDRLGPGGHTLLAQTHEIFKDEVYGLFSDLE